MELAEVLGLVVVLGIIALIVLVVLRRAIVARAGSFDVSWRRRRAADDRGWLLGQARYRGGQLCLYRAFSVLPTAALILNRDDFTLGPVRPPIGAEPDLLPPGVVIVPGAATGIAIEMALSPDALTALRSWVESRPPGMRRPDRERLDGSVGDAPPR